MKSSSCCLQDKVEVFIYVYSWVLHILYLRVDLLGNKTFWLWCFDGSSYHYCYPHRPLLHLQVNVTTYIVLLRGKVSIYLSLHSFVSLDGCWFIRFSRAGSVVLALHDASDVFLEVGKMSKYSGFEGIAAFSFVLFALSWVLLRLIYYPFWILWSTRFVYIQQLFYLECVLLDLCLKRCCWVAAIRLLWLWTRKSIQSKGRSTTTCSTLSCFVCLCFTYSGGFWFTGCLWNKYRIEASLVKMSDPVCSENLIWLWYACFGSLK